MIKESVAYAAGTGAIDPRYADVFAHIVLAAVNEVAMMIALGGESAATLEASEDAVGDFLDRLLSPRPES